jgi:NAD(P) transhydrogenase subunit beta
MGLRIPMTAVPQRTALVALARALAACPCRRRPSSSAIRGQLGRRHLTALDFEVIVGGLTFTGSLIAAAKLQEMLPGRPITYSFRTFSTSRSSRRRRDRGVPRRQRLGSWLFYLMVFLAFGFGLLLVIPIGAADMPTVIALLNRYGGLADAAMGFVLMNKIQIITGSLDGTSGFLLALLMCRAMNRSAMNVLFGAFGKVAPKDGR